MRGDKQPALVSLDAFPPHVREKVEAEAITSGGGLTVSCVEFLEKLGFNDAERALLIERLEGTGRVKLAERIGTRTVERLRKTIQRKLARLRGRDLKPTEVTTILRADPSRTMLLERFHSGGMVWRPK